MNLQRAYSLLDLSEITRTKAQGDEDDSYWTVKGIASTPKPDRLNDIVDPLGAQFAKEIPLLWQHRHEQPVGHTYLGKPTKNGIPFEARIPKVREAGALKDRVDEAIQSLQHRLVGAVSIGFRVLNDAMEYLENGGIKFSEIEIMELSLVTIPAHMDATISSVKSIDQETRSALAQNVKPRGEGLTHSKAGVAATTVSLSTKPPEGSKVKTIAEQIAAFEAKRMASAERMNDIMSKAAEEERTLEPEEKEDYDTLSTEVKAVDEHLARLRELERTQVARAKPVPEVKSLSSGSEARGPVITAGKSQLPQGMEFARYVRCLVMAKGDPMRALEIAKANFQDNTRVINVLKAAVAAGTTTDSTWAGPLVDYQTLAEEFIEFLRPMTIIGKFGQNGIPALRRVPFNVRMSRQTSGGAGYWVGQGAPKPLTKFDYDEVTLQWAKVANIAVLTEELVRFSNPSADTLVRQALAEALTERLDIDFVDPAKAAVANVSPASIVNGVTPIVASGTDAAAVRDDVQSIMQTFIAANLTPTNGVWIMSSTNALAISLMQNALGQPSFPGLTMTGGTFAGLPVITSEHMASVAESGGSPIILVNASDVFLADDGGISIDASREASLEMLDNPTNNSSSGTATSMVSMFQTNSVALRAERMINWQKRRAAAAALIVDAAYSA